jgi:hypothetical protein
LKERVLTWLIYTYLGLGAAFGLLTASNRHFFSEGPATAPEARHTTVIDGPVMWVVTSMALWPVLLLSGAYGAWRRWLRRRA